MKDYLPLGKMSRLSHGSLKLIDPIVRRHCAYGEKMLSRISRTKVWHRKYSDAKTRDERWDLLGSLLEENPSYYLPTFRLGRKKRCAVWVFVELDSRNSVETRFGLLQSFGKLEIRCTERTTPAQALRFLNRVYVTTHLPAVTGNSVDR